MLIIRLFLLIFTASIVPRTVACSHFYLDRKDLSQIINIDLDILDEYTLEQPLLVTNPKLLRIIKKSVPDIHFTLSKKTNKVIQNHLLTNIHLLKVFPIKGLKHPYRNGFLVQNALNKELFYSFIIYVPNDCSIN